MTVLTSPRIDAHLHLWDLDGGGYDWLTPDLGPLHASFSGVQAERELHDAGVDGAILVQADDTEQDTQAMLTAADRFGWVRGVVGWVRLERPEVALEQLDRWQQHPRFCGVRHLVHVDPRTDLLDRPEVRQTLRCVAERGLAFDVPDAWPEHLRSTRDLAADLPGLRVVVDHLAKPPADDEERRAWRERLAEVAALPNTYAKVSGLHHGGRMLPVEVLREVWDTALDLFGPERLMYGGDWPMTVPGGGYRRWWSAAAELVSELSPAEQDLVLHTTAVTVYALQPGVTDA